MAELLEWKFDPREILASKRKVKGIFHKAVIDKDDELITPDAIKKSIPDYMHLPALHDFHKERPVGLATKIWQEKDGSFGFEGVIKSTEDCDDIWEKISKGNYDHVSIFGRRTEGNSNCSLPQGLRTGPCITNGVRLDSISVCDDNARNDSTSLSVKKAQLIWDGMDMIQKAEVEKGHAQFTGSRPRTTSTAVNRTRRGDESGDMHSITIDGVKHSRPTEEQKKEASRTPRREEKKAETAGESGLMHTATDDPEKKCPCSKTISKEMEKGFSETSHNLGLGKEERTQKTAKRYHVIGPGKGNKIKVRVESMTPSAGRADVRSKTYRKGDEGDDMDVEKGVKSHPLHVVAGSTKGTNEATRHMYEGQDAVSSGGKRGELNPKYKPGHRVKKGDEEDDEMSDEEAPKEMEKGIRFVDADEDDKKTYADHRREEKPGYKKPKKPGDVKKGKATITEEPADRCSSGQSSNADIREPGDAGYEGTGQRTTRDSSGRSGTMRKGDVSEEDADDDNQYDEESDSSKKKVSPKDKEGQWSKDKNPQGSVKVKKAEKEQEIDTETRGEDAKEEMDEDEDEEDVEKSHEGKPWSQKQGQASVGNMVHEMRATDKKIKQKTKGLPEKEASEGMRNLHKGIVKKGDTMDEEEVSQEYVTKAMVPIEEVDTIIKARTEEISKAYTAQFDEIKKAYDAKIAELTTRVDKMSEETIRKGGSIVVIPQLLDPQNQGFGSNADALAKIMAGK